MCELLNGLFMRRGGKVGIEPYQGCPEIPHQHSLPLRHTSKCAVLPEGLGVIGVNAIPSEMIAEMIGKSLLNESVFTVDVGNHDLSPDDGGHILHDPEGPLQIEFQEITGPQDRPKLRFHLSM